MRDDLRQPLKRHTLADRIRQLKPGSLQVASSFILIGTLFVGSWLYTHDVPNAGQPIVTAKIHPLEKLTTASNPPPKQPVEQPPKRTPAEIVQPANRHLRVFSPQPDPADVAADKREAGQGKVAIIMRPGRITAKPLRRAPIKAVSERGPFGMLPKIAKNGRRPSQVYATRLSKKVLNSGRPKIAIVINGMGINAKLTRKAIRELPGQITFAFAPYGSGLQSMVNRARASGHEVILHLPMEPYGYPGINPGPKTLLAAAEPLDNIKSLQWLLSRFSGYTGVTNYMGARFTADGGAMLPVFARLKARGLIYFDDGSNGAALTGSIAQAVKLPAKMADITIDTTQSAATIQSALSALEDAARKNGVAIGVGTGLELTIDILETWTRELSDHGFMLVPLSAAYRGVKS